MNPHAQFVRQITSNGSPGPIVRFRNNRQARAEAAFAAIAQAHDNPLTAYKRKRVTKTSSIVS